MLSPDHPFRWETIRIDPKGAHPTLSVREDWYKTMNYDILDSNGFLLLHTMRGRVYWVTQNNTGHVTPDWKIHFSVNEEDVPKAWNILAQLFIDFKCEIGMKATTTASSFCVSSQRGRELTVYIYVYDERLRSGVMYEQSPETGNDLFIGSTQDSECDFYLGKEYEGVYTPEFWYRFIFEGEKRFFQDRIRSNGGCASGDLPLPHCQYASLRNEAFVIEDLQVGLQYPSNAASWNAAKHKNPLEETIYLLLLNPPNHLTPFSSLIHQQQYQGGEQQFHNSDSSTIS
jgi:hypothetical protein